MPVFHAVSSRIVRRADRAIARPETRLRTLTAPSMDSLEKKRCVDGVIETPTSGTFPRKGARIVVCTATCGPGRTRRGLAGHGLLSRERARSRLPLSLGQNAAEACLHGEDTPQGNFWVLGERLVVLKDVVVEGHPTAADGLGERAPLLDAVHRPRRPLPRVGSVGEEEVRVDDERVGL